MFSSQMNPGSPFLVLTGDVVCTDVVGERFADACVFEKDRYGGGSVMVSGGISQRVKSPLIVVPGNLTAVRYRDEILRPVAVPLVQQHQMTFQHDNARPHVARVCQDSGKQQHCTTRLATVQSRFVPNSAFVGRTGQARKKTMDHPPTLSGNCEQHCWKSGRTSQ